MNERMPGRSASQRKSKDHSTGGTLTNQTAREKDGKDFIVGTCDIPGGIKLAKEYFKKSL
jgi:hypothetical protein